MIELLLTLLKRGDVVAAGLCDSDLVRGHNEGTSPWSYG
jgi:hypothetical protein